ncbi:hypothetical protein [Niallia taxi]|uniref:hypothetical protein n=1 Tax=Niallia taxi TaxID=2499688 RepID=UPI0015F51BA8|nr:hypothetical protein [Niallia taxi]
MNVIYLPKYRFTKKEARIHLGYKDVDFLIDVLEEQRDGFFSEDSEYDQPILFTIDSVLEDLHDFSTLNKLASGDSILSISTLEADLLELPLRNQKVYYPENEKEGTILQSYIDCLMIYIKKDSKDITRFMNLPIDVQMEVLREFYSAPFGHEVRG